MRRSNAPSVACNVAKRAKFLPPLKNNNVSVNSTSQASNEISHVANKFGISLCGEQDNQPSFSQTLHNEHRRHPLVDIQEKEVGDEKSSILDVDIQRVSNEQKRTHFLTKPSKFVSPINNEHLSKNKATHLERCDKNSEDKTETDKTKQTLQKNISVKSSSSPFVCTSSSKFASPLVSSGARKHINVGESVSDVEVYYSVVWCKASNKKHKKWEGDGILIVCGKQVMLKDMEAKQIAKGSGYKSIEISDMCDGSTLKISGKEIEVQGKICKEDYLSGKCFFGSEMLQAPGKIQSKILNPKPFIPHCRPEGLQNAAITDAVATPRHDPNKEGALVMPRPNKLCQWNAGKGQVVDVVVDPFISYHLRPHQREGVTFLYECVMGMRPTPGNGAILADEMGLGKTLQCISLIWTLLKQSPYPGTPCVKKVIIITPGSLVKNWCQEFTKWLGSERLIPFAVNKDNRVNEFLLHNKDPVMVISYEMLLRCIEDIRKVKFNLVICDEAHRLKNAKIKTGTALSSLGIGKRILLTGTPIQNNLEEFYTLAEVAIPGILGSLAVFKKVFVEPITRSQQPDCDDDERDLGTNRTVELTRLIGMFCLRRTAEINKAYLPPKVEHAVFIKMSELQLKIYNHLLKSSLVRSCLLYAYNGSSHLVCIDAMKKLCNDPILIYKKCENEENNEQEDFLASSDLKSVFPDDYLMQNPLSHSAKLGVLDKMLQSLILKKEKCVIVSNSTKTLDILQTFCDSLNYTYVRLDGQTQMSARQSIVNRFNDKSSSTFIFLLSSKAGGVGLNLTGASKLILYDIDWNPANDMQSMARVWRDGQKHEVHIYRFIITSSIEEKMYQRQVSKQTLSGSVVDSVGFSNSAKAEFSKEDLKDLFTLKETDTCITHDLLQCNCMNGLPFESTMDDKYSESIQKNASMAELMKWEHVSDLQSIDKLDEGLKSCENITFMFRSKSS